MGSGSSALDLSLDETKVIVKEIKNELEQCRNKQLSPVEIQSAITQKYQEIINRLGDHETRALKRSNTMELLRLSEYMSASLKGFEINMAGSEPSVPSSPVDHSWTETMTMKSGELDFLLRRPLHNDSDIEYTLAAAEAGLLFMDELDRVSSSLNFHRGTLSRWLLPFDAKCIAADQVSSVDEVIRNTPDSLKGKLTACQIHYLVSGVNGVRQLIRVKIADDNDLEQARRALCTAREFLLRLQNSADTMTNEGHAISPFQLYQSHSI